MIEVTDPKVIEFLGPVLTIKEKLSVGLTLEQL
jgi:hypothetical protein